MIPKEHLITMRVSAEDKEALEEAARARGQSLTKFLIDSGRKQARSKRKPKLTGPLPTFFRALCEQAKLGGANGYWTAGHELTRHLDALKPYDIESESRWLAEIEHLAGYIDDGDDDASWEWFEKYLPRCAALVPKRRRESFIAGVADYAEDNDGLHY